MKQDNNKFSALRYQEELIEKLSSDLDSNTSGWIYFIDDTNNVWRINAESADFIDQISSYTPLPNLQESIIAMANIQEKEVMLIDVNSFLHNNPSKLRIGKIPSTFKCLTLKGFQIGLVLNILPSFIDDEDPTINELNVKHLLHNLLIKKE